MGRTGSVLGQARDARRLRPARSPVRKRGARPDRRHRREHGSARRRRGRFRHLHRRAGHPAERQRHGDGGQRQHRRHGGHQHGIRCPVHVDVQQRQLEHRADGDGNGGGRRRQRRRDGHPHAHRQRWRLRQRHPRPVRRRAGRRADRHGLRHGRRRPDRDQLPRSAQRHPLGLERRWRGVRRRHHQLRDRVPHRFRRHGLPGRQRRRRRAGRLHRLRADAGLGFRHRRRWRRRHRRSELLRQLGAHRRRLRGRLRRQPPPHLQPDHRPCRHRRAVLHHKRHRQEAGAGTRQCPRHRGAEQGGGAGRRAGRHRAGLLEHGQRRRRGPGRRPGESGRRPAGGQLLRRSCPRHLHRRREFPARTRRRAGGGGRRVGADRGLVRRRHRKGAPSRVVRWPAEPRRNAPRQLRHRQAIRGWYFGSCDWFRRLLFKRCPQLQQLVRLVHHGSGRLHRRHVPKYRSSASAHQGGRHLRRLGRPRRDRRQHCGRGSLGLRHEQPIPRAQLRRPRHRFPVRHAGAVAGLRQRHGAG